MIPYAIRATAWLAAAATLATSVPAEPPQLVPAPAALELRTGAFLLTPQTVIVVDTENRAIADWIAEGVQRAAGFRPAGDRNGSAAPVTTIALQIVAGGGDGAASQGDTGRPPPQTAEAYTLDISPERVRLTAARPAGLMRGAATLRQLIAPQGWERRGDTVLTSIQLPALLIRDEPRFRWRGFMLDCGRYFVPKERIQRQLDLIALHKLNVFHWHLTDDQGWRLAVRNHPRLTEVGAWRRVTRDAEKVPLDASDPRDQNGRAAPIPAGEPGVGRYGGFNSPDDVREIVAYAAARHILVVPEIELPGHSVAALAAYPELSCTGGPFEVSTTWGVHEDVFCAGNDAVFALVEDVLSEVCELFPGEYVHIGGDECPKTRWKACAKCQARIRAEGLKDEHELQSWFIRRVEKFLARKGKRLIGWDEILEGGLAPNATVQSWRGLDGALAAARAGHDVISSPTSHCYLDYAQGRTPGEPVQMGMITLLHCGTFEPIPSGLTVEQKSTSSGWRGISGLSIARLR